MNMELDRILRVISYQCGGGEWFSLNGLSQILCQDWAGQTHEVWSRGEAVSSYPSPTTTTVQPRGLTESGEPLCTLSSKWWLCKYAPLWLLSGFHEMMCIKHLALCLAPNKLSNQNFCYCPFLYDLTCRRPQIFGRVDSETSRKPGLWALEMMTPIPGSAPSHMSPSLEHPFPFSSRQLTDFHIPWHSLSNHMATFTRKWNFHWVLSSTKLGCWWSSPPLPSYETPSPSQPCDMHCSNLCFIKMTNDWRLAGGGRGLSQNFGSYRVNMRMPRYSKQSFLSVSLPSSLPFFLFYSLFLSPSISTPSTQFEILGNPRVSRLQGNICHGQTPKARTSGQSWAIKHSSLLGQPA